jgi:hypothetical protein
MTAPERPASHWSLDLYLAYLSKLTPPDGPFDAAGAWQHAYDVFPIYSGGRRSRGRRRSLWSWCQRRRSSTGSPHEHSAQWSR